MATVNAQYTVAKPESLPTKIASYQRRRMYERFLTLCRVTPEDSILDVGATSDSTYSHSNYLEAWYPLKHRLTAVGLDDASFLERVYPGLTFRRIEGRSLPFDSGSFDHVHSSAVLEHVGSQEMQIQFLSELWRVARKAVFVTTPNRWFPVEFHTILPLAHWLPPKIFRSLLRAVGREFFADEQNLNLISKKQLVGMAERVGLTSFRVDSVALLGWPSNLLLSAQKD